IDECVAKLRDVKADAGDATADAASEVMEKFTAALDDDLNVSSAWGVVFDWVRDCNRRLAENQMGAATAAAELAAWERIDTVLGVGKAEEEAPVELTALLEERAEARKAKDFARADAIRDELAKEGWVIEDTPKGARLKRG
ncbi:MAG: cysteine--tRNA ligase, partial [Verrucomicrobiota bacterium]|nr:cysteine--tRNA ligase [Verrucomicrobiota bacterium]